MLSRVYSAVGRPGDRHRFQNYADCERPGNNGGDHVARQPIVGETSRPALSGRRSRQSH